MEVNIRDTVSFSFFFHNEIYNLSDLFVPAPPGRGGYPQQPHFSSSPHQAHHFPPNQHRAPSNNFNQVPQIPPQMASNTPATSGSGTHSAEATDEGK